MKSNANIHFTNETEIDTIPLGDINNDRILDNAFVKGPKWLNEKDGWGDPQFYNISISFSCNLPSIESHNAVGAFVENIGDIDNDGFSEIIIVPEWFIGCWGRINFYSIKTNKWKYIGFAERNVCEEDSYKPFIKKIGKNKIQVMQQVWNDKVADRVEKNKIIKVN
jgi:hypothetical protein